MPDIKRVGRKTVYQNHWITVHEDAVRFRDGSDGIYGVVEKEDFALIIPRHADGRFQLVQQYRYPVGARYWEFPQGAWDAKPEADPETVALGELEEETGFRSSALHKLGFLYEAYGFASHGCHVFLADGLQPGMLDRDDGEQGMLTAAFHHEEIAQMIRSGEIRDATTVASMTLLAHWDGG